MSKARIRERCAVAGRLCSLWKAEKNLEGKECRLNLT
jgi:hypothetical protein